MGWTLGNDEHEFVDIKPAVSMHVMPMKLSTFGLPRRAEVQVQAAKNSKHAARKRWNPAERGTAARPRLSVHKTNLHLYAQVVDDEKVHTLAQASTSAKMLNGAENPLFGMKKNKETARVLGEKIAEIANSKGINEVVFDRGRYKYHGIVKEIAEGARSKGLIDNVNPERHNVAAAAS